MVASVNHVTIFGLDLTIDSVAFKLPIGENGWTVYWYGILIALGFVCALVYGYSNAKRFGVDTDRMLDVILVATPCAVLGARTYYVLFDPNGQINSVSEFFGLNGSGFSGLAIYGGIIGAVVSGIIVAKIRKVRIFNLLDLASIGFLIGQGIGRWGNFFNQEAFGGPTGSDFWGMTSENVVSKFIIEDLDPNALAHPCFLYESVWCIAGAVLLHFISKKRKFSGQVALSYCVWYGFGRAIIETMRTDSLAIIPIADGTDLAFFNRVSFVLSLLICIIAAVVLILLLKKNKASALEQGYNLEFESVNEEQSTDIEEDFTKAEEENE